MPIKPFAILGTVSILGVAYAQTFPAVPTRGTVYDGAHLLSPSDVAAINSLSAKFRRDTGAPIVVATLPSLDSVGAQGEGIERYSTQLFDRWGIGHRRQGGNGGILLVVAKGDRKARIELGKDWRHDYDAGAHAIMQSTILPAFKKADYSGGIVRGCEALAKLSQSPSPNPATRATAFDPDQSEIPQHPLTFTVAFVTSTSAHSSSPAISWSSSFSPCSLS